MPTRRQRGAFGSLLDIGTRLLVWAIIGTVLFRCPGSIKDLSESSPAVCRPYLHVRDYATPYVQPYYDAYAAPYVLKASPYAETFKQRVYNPITTVTKSTYRKYGAPRVAQVWDVGRHEWQGTVVPMFDKWTARATDQYQKYLGPHVDSAYANVSPYINHAYSATSPNIAKAQEAVQGQYENVLVPAYEKSIPYLQVVYNRGKVYVLNYGLPYSRMAFDTAWTFVSRQIWPHIRILYGRNVEPQLSKIRERLGSYRDSRKVEAAVDAVDDISSSSVSATTPTENSPLSSIASALGISSTEETSVLPSSVASSVTPGSSAHDVTEDLRRWQQKFKAASEEGAQDLAKRIVEISQNHITTSAQGTGDAIVTQLEEASSSTLRSLKGKIIDAVSSLSEDASEEEQDDAYAAILTRIRKAGNDIKSKAQDLRKWKLSYESELESLVQDATDSTLDVIDGIRDLGLQEIGIRWANSEHVTWQDWAEYHKLKRTFDDWRVKVSDVAEKNDGVKEAKQAGAELEDRGMGVVQEAAEGLAQLKEATKWKIHARDVSDDFAPKTLPAAAARLGQRILNQAKAMANSVAGTTTSQGMVESIMSAASSGGEDALSSVSSAVVTPVQEAASSLATPLSETLQSATEASGPIVESISSMSSQFSDSSSPTTSDLASSSSSLLSAMSSAAFSLLPSASSSDSSPESDAPIALSLASAMSSAAASILPSLSPSLPLPEALLPSGENKPLASSISAALSSYTSAAASMAPSSASALSSHLDERIDSLLHAAGYSSETLSVPDVASTIAAHMPSVGISGDDIVNAAAGVSEGVRSRVEQAAAAGEEVYETVTKTLAMAASSLAAEL